MEDYISENLKLGKKIRDIPYLWEENGPQSYVIWEIDKIAENKSKLTITVHPFILAKLSNCLPTFRTIYL